MNSLSRAVRLAFLALTLAAASAHAQVDYVRELVGTQDTLFAYILAVTQAPVDTGNPSYDGLANDQYIFTISQYFTVDSAMGVVSPYTRLPLELKLSTTSLVAESGQGTSSPNFSAINFGTRILFQYTPSYTPITVRIDLHDTSPYSLAAANGTTPLALIADNHVPFV